MHHSGDGGTRGCSTNSFKGNWKKEARTLQEKSRLIKEAFAETKGSPPTGEGKTGWLVSGRPFGLATDWFLVFNHGDGLCDPGIGHLPSE